MNIVNKTNSVGRKEIIEFYGVRVYVKLMIYAELLHKKGLKLEDLNQKLLFKSIIGNSTHL